METIIAFINYTTNVPYFWASMGVVVAIGMFVGALLYKGKSNELIKLLFAVGSYATMILWFNTSRIYFLYGINNDLTVKVQAFAGSFTVLFLSLFWLFGIISGAVIIRISKH